MSQGPGSFLPQDWASLLSEHGSGPGHADVVLLGDDPNYVRAISFALLVYLMATPEFGSALIIAPPTHVAADAVVERVNKILVANNQAPVAGRLVQRRTATLDSTHVVRLCRECGEGVLIYVLGAGQFRSSNVATQPQVTSTEDMWVAHVVSLATELSAVLDGTSSYAVLDVGHFPPVRKENRALLEESPLQVISMEVPETSARIASAILKANAEDSGSIGDALSEIAAARDLEPKVHALLQAAALHGAERYVGAWEVLSRFWDDWSATADARVLVELARIAVDAGEFPSARTVLAKIDVAALPAELIESALVCAARCDRELEKLFLERLITLRPDSEFAAAHAINASIRDQDWELLKSHASRRELNIDADERVALTDLAEALQSSDSEWEECTNRFIERWPARADWARTLFAREAFRRRLYPEAVVQCIAVSPDSEEGPRAASLAIDTVEAVLLQRTEDGEFVLPDMVLARVVAFAAHHAARAPRDARLRTKLTQLLSPGVVGARGEALLLYLIEHLASEPEREEALVVADTTLEEIRALFDSIIEMVESASAEKPIVWGVGRLPDSIEKEQARRLLHVLPEIVDQSLQVLDDQGDVQTARLVLHAALLTCERAGARRVGLMLLRHFAVRLAATGWAQDARDTVEHGLVLVSEAPADRRVAWATFGDIYHRVGNLHEALVGVLLAISFPQVMLRAEEAWQELFLLVRLLRDLGLYEGAEAMLRRADSLLTMTETKRARLDSIQLSIELRRHDAKQHEVPEQGLIDRLAQNVERLLELDDDVIPPLSLLLQLVARARAVGLETPPALMELIERALAKLPPTIRTRLVAFGAPAPDLATVRSLMSRAGTVRASEDIGYDIHPAAIVAQRALRQAESFDEWSVVELIEVLADKTVVTPTNHGDPLEVRRGAAYLLERGHTIQMLGLDETGCLVRVTLRPDQPPVLKREPKDVFDSLAFRDWKKVYPFEYCYMDDPDSMRCDLVRRSVDLIRISDVGHERTVIVSDVRVAGFPMNLLRVGNDFAGELAAISSAPCLAWLAEIARTPRAPTGRRIAWISDAVPLGGTSPALAPLADRLEPVLAEHHVALTRSRQIPNDLGGADLAIVTAHGGLSPDDRFFQVVADDADDRWSPRDLADAVANASIAVLFVCSAGRFDEHPRARAAVGLPKLLLAAGVRTVIASPWPLDTSVPPRWLPTFLAKLAESACVSDAVYAANQEVARAFSGNPPHAFAMHVYGDPTQCLPPTK